MPLAPLLAVAAIAAAAAKDNLCWKDDEDPGHWKHRGDPDLADLAEDVMQRGHGPLIASWGGEAELLFALELSHLFVERLRLYLPVRHFSASDHEYQCATSRCCIDNKHFHVLISPDNGPTCDMKLAGSVGYSSGSGIYYHIPASASNASLPRTDELYADWYLSYLRDRKLLNLFQPLPVENTSTYKNDCNAAWNARHPMEEGRQWCSPTGRFVPPHCERGGCMELYHTEPQYLEGKVEALITQRSFPFVVHYIGEESLMRLRDFGQPFVTLAWLPGHVQDMHRIQFPVEPPCLLARRTKIKPDTYMKCDLHSPPVLKYASQEFKVNFPAAWVLLQRMEISTERMEKLMDLDQHHEVFFKEEHDDEVLCNEYWAWFNALVPSPLGCVYADQEFDPKHNRCVCHPGRAWNGTDCNACPTNSYCMRGKTRSCGNTDSVSPGRRRRARGPSSPEDCLCSPGSGSGDDNSSQVCELCSENVYKPHVGSEVCSNACPAHSTSEVGAASMEDCFCVPGYFRSSPSSCLKCNNSNVSVFCNGIDRPRAMASYFIELKEGERGVELVEYKCPAPVACIGDNKCAKGTEGPFCTVCSPGYVRGVSAKRLCDECNGLVYHMRYMTLWLTIFTVYVVYFGSVIGTGASKDVNIIAMVVKLTFHQGFLTWLVAAFPPPVSWTSPVALVLSRFQLDYRCALEGLGLRDICQRAVGACAVLVLLPLASLVVMFLLSRIVARLKQKRIERRQVEVKRVNELIDMCDWLEDLHVRDTARMESIKTEFKGYREDVINKSRILGIWRTVFEDHSAKAATPDEAVLHKKFLLDSQGLILNWLIILHPFVTRDILCIYNQWIPPDKTPANGYVLGSAVEFFSVQYMFYAVPLTIVFYGFSFGFPIFCFWKIRRNYARQKLLQMDRCVCWGYMYYGLEIKSPNVFFEIIFMFERVLMGLLAEEDAFDNDGFSSQSKGAITLMILVFFAVRPPFEKVHYHVLDNLMGLAILCCVITPEVDLIGRDVTPQSFWEALSKVGTYAEGTKSLEHLLKGLELVAIFIINMIFWIRIVHEIITETLTLLFYCVSILHEELQSANVSALAVAAKFEDLVANHPLSPFILLKKFHGFLMARQQRFLAVTMECETRLAPGAKGGPYVSIREIVLHENKHEMDLIEDQRFRENFITKMHSNAHNSKSAVDIATEVKEQNAGVRKSVNSFLGHTSSIAATTRKHSNAKTGMERSDLAIVLSEAVETLMIIHNLEVLPFCVIEFILADALCCMRKGWSTESDRRREVFRFVWFHPSGQVRGVEELFDQCPGSPMLSQTLRLKDLQEFAKRLSQEVVTERLLVRDIQHYVRQLRFQDAHSVQKLLMAFADAIKADVYCKPVNVEHKDSGAQTSFQSTRSVQTEATVSAGTQTDTILPSGEKNIRREEDVAGTEGPLCAMDQSSDEVNLNLREEAETARREAQILEEEAELLMSDREEGAGLPPLLTEGEREQLALLATEQRAAERLEEEQKASRALAEKGKEEQGSGRKPSRLPPAPPVPAGDSKPLEQQEEQEKPLPAAAAAEVPLPAVPESTMPSGTAARPASVGKRRMHWMFKK